MAHVEKFEDLGVWKLAKDVANKIYDITSLGEFSKDFVLRDQIRRAAVSIFSNIAEGFERNGNKEFINFLYIAKASCGEVRSQLIFAMDRKYISKTQYERIQKQLFTLSKQLAGFIKYLRNSNVKGARFK